MNYTEKRLEEFIKEGSHCIEDKSIIASYLEDLKCKI